MTKRHMRHILPNMEKVKNKRGFSKIGIWMEKHPYLFSLQRKKVALGFAIGMGIGVIPLPIQVFLSIFLCYALRANIPATILAAIIMNPLSYPFVLALILQIGSFFCENDVASITFPASALFLSHPIIWLEQIGAVGQQVGMLLLVGTPITAMLMAYFSYWLIKAGWYIGVIIQWKNRPWRNQKSSNEIISNYQEQS